MDVPANSMQDDGAAQDPDVEEISVHVTDDDLVALEGPDWDLLLSADEARQLADALRDAAAEAEGATV